MATHIPALKYDAELTAGTISKAMKLAEGAQERSAAGGLFRVPASHMKVRDDFNVRIKNDAYEAQVLELMHLIRENGFDATRPLTGFVAQEEGGDVIYITDGHRRQEAVLRLQNDAENPVEIGPLPIIISPQTETLEDQLVGLKTRNSGQPLSVFETALVCKRLDNLQVPHERIAKRLDITDRYLRDLLKLSGAPAKIRSALIGEKISATEALKQMKLHGKDAGDKVESAVKKAEEKGKTKATGKDAKDGGEGGEEAGDKSSVVTKNGKVHEKHVYIFKQGQIVDTDSVRHIQRFKNADWWDYVDSKSKSHVVINFDIKFEIAIVYAEAAAATDEQPEGEGAAKAGDPETEDQGDGSEGGDAGAAGAEGGAPAEGEDVSDL